MVAESPAGARSPRARIARALAPLVILVLLLGLDVGLAQLYNAFLDPARKQDQQRHFRFMHPIYHHDLQANHDEMTYDLVNAPYRMVTNSLGLRDATPRRVDPAAAQRRVLVIGDSFLEAAGVDYADSAAGILGAALAPRGIEVLNAAVVSYSPIIYWRKVKHLLETVGLRPEHVVVFIDISDICDEAIYYRRLHGDRVVGVNEINRVDCFEEPVRRRRPAGLWQRNSLLGRALGALQGREPDMMSPASALWRRAAWTWDEEVFKRYGAEGLERSTKFMDELAALLRARGVGLTVVVYPWPHQLLRGERDSRHARHFRDWAARRGAGFVDLFPVFLDQGDPRETYRRLFVPRDVHWNRAGHRLVAEAVLRGLSGLAP